MIENGFAMKNGTIFGKCISFCNNNIGKTKHSQPPTLFRSFCCDFPHFPLTRSIEFQALTSKSQLAF